jgi:2'-5' RNA ligase
MAFIYTSNHSRWVLPWQLEYRFGIILVVPPEPVFSQVNALRAAHDPKSQSFCDAHISLSVPLPMPMSEVHWDQLTAIAARIPSFTVEYGPLEHYLPFPGVCLQIQPQATLDQTRIAIESTPVFSGASPRKYSYNAHMTIAEFITVEQTLPLMELLASSSPKGRFTCRHLSYMIPDESFRFIERARLPLAP